MKVSEFIRECENFQYSKEYFDLYKEATELDVMNTWLECQEFKAAHAEDENFNESYFVESPAQEKVEEKKTETDEKEEGFFKSIWTKIKSLFSRFWNWVKSFFTKNDISKEAAALNKTVEEAKKKEVANGATQQEAEQKVEDSVADACDKAKNSTSGTNKEILDGLDNAEVKTGSAATSNNTTPPPPEKKEPETPPETKKEEPAPPEKPEGPTQKEITASEDGKKTKKVPFIRNKQRIRRVPKFIRDIIDNGDNYKNNKIEIYIVFPRTSIPAEFSKDVADIDSLRGLVVALSTKFEDNTRSFINSLGKKVDSITKQDLNVYLRDIKNSNNIGNFKTHFDKFESDSKNFKIEKKKKSKLMNQISRISTIIGVTIRYYQTCIGGIRAYLYRVNKILKAKYNVSI